MIFVCSRMCVVFSFQEDLFFRLFFVEENKFHQYQIPYETPINKQHQKNNGEAHEQLRSLMICFLVGSSIVPCFF